MTRRSEVDTCMDLNGGAKCEGLCMDVGTHEREALSMDKVVTQLTAASTCPPPWRCWHNSSRIGEPWGRHGRDAGPTSTGSAYKSFSSYYYGRMANIQQQRVTPSPPQNTIPQGDQPDSLVDFLDIFHPGRNNLILARMDTYSMGSHFPSLGSQLAT